MLVAAMLRGVFLRSVSRRVSLNTDACAGSKVADVYDESSEEESLILPYEHETHLQNQVCHHPSFYLFNFMFFAVLKTISLIQWRPMGGNRAEIGVKPMAIHCLLTDLPM